MGRDLGKMGELAFGQMCASVGLTANRSLEADKTGWDYLVEFDFDSTSTPEISTIHHGALECKVQVKSTDKRDRKCSITLSNLKRLATAKMPTFVLFLEFDGEDSAQRLFLRHLDASLCAQVLSRLHDAERKGQSHRLHKQKMVIHYNEDHLLGEVSGAALSAAIKRHVGTDVAKYVTQKMDNLSSVGLEDGFAELTFTAEGDDTVQDLIAMSLGLDVQAEVFNVEAILKRFGKKGSTPFIKEESVKIGMPDVKPNYEGQVKVRLEKMGIPLSLPGELYFSQFNSRVPQHMQQARLKTDFFDVVFHLHAKGSSCTIRVPQDPMPIRRLRDGLKICHLLYHTDRQLHVELEMPPLPTLTLSARGMNNEGPFELQSALDATETGIRVLSTLSLNDATISLVEAIKKAAGIIELEDVLKPGACNIKFDFSTNAEIPIAGPHIFLAFHYAPIGDVLVGAFITMTGTLLANGNGNYTMLAEQKNIERILVRERGQKVATADLVEAAAEIRKKYEGDYFVLTSIQE